MTNYDVQGIEIDAPYDAVFDFLAEPANLPRWTNAFVRVDGRRALMRTPAGEIDVMLDCFSSHDFGHIDTTIHFPDGTSLTAWSRLVGDSRKSCYSFVLPAPPPALEGLEGGLEDQRKILAEELRVAKGILEGV